MAIATITIEDVGENVEIRSHFDPTLESQKGSEDALSPAQSLAVTIMSDIQDYANQVDRLTNPPTEENQT